MENKVSSDTELLQRARQLDFQALAQVYDLFSPGLYRYAMRRLGDQNLAEDCVAETFSRFLHAVRSHRGPDDHLQAYLYRMAHNWISDHYRHRPPPDTELNEEVRDDGIAPEESVELRGQQHRIRSALKQLTPDQQQVILLKYLENWENEEIALAMKKPVGAIKSLQHRALAALQRILRNEVLV
jgi:RNA polymerase sigma-70 factor (ECF subfamily)